MNNSKIRFYNAKILTMIDGQDWFEGEVHTEDERIIYIGKQKDTVSNFTREIDCHGNLLMPGFKNAHTHSGMTGLRSYADDLPLQDWLFNQVFPVEGKLTAEEVALFTKLAILEYLTSGITSIFDMYLTPYSIAEACEESGMRCVQVSGINRFGPTLEVLEERFLAINKRHPLSSFMMGFHAEYTCERELLEAISALVHKYKVPVFTHNSETRLEVDECIQRYDKTPTQLFEELGLYDFGGGGFHCVYLDKEDIEIFKKRKLTIVTNPASNLKLASGIAPIATFLANEIPVAIGTDGPASNNCLDMFREMFLVTGLAKVTEKNASVVDALEVLKMATTNGALAMGLTDCDVLAEGKLADMIMIDLNQPNMQPLNNIAKNIVYSGSKLNVKMTMIHGEIRYENGTFSIGMDPATIYKEANEIMARIKSEL